MREDSILELFDQLCELHLGPAKKFHRKQPLISRVKAKKQLKSKLWTTVFESLLVGKRNEKERILPKEAEGVALEIYHLRVDQMHTEADQLESSFHSLYADENNDLKSCLRLLVNLKGSGDDPLEDKFKRNVFQLQVPEDYGKELTHLPNRSNQHFYEHFPVYMFDSPHVDILKGGERNIFDAFSCDPGLGLNEDMIFSSMSCSKDGSLMGSNLFGGLLQGKTHHVNVSLEIPDLDLNGPPDFKIPELKPSSSQLSLSEESGVESGATSMSSSVISALDQPVSSSVISALDQPLPPHLVNWELALTEKLSQHYTWEWIGYQPGPTERPHLTEAGAKIFDLLILLRRRVASIADPRATLVVKPPVSAQEVTANILHLLVGIQSKLFPLNQETDSFEVVPGLSINGLTWETLADVVTPFLEAGTFVRRLWRFASLPVCSSTYNQGHTFAAFLSAVKMFLHHYRAVVLQVPPTQTLLQLGIYLRTAMEQIRYLAHLCHCQKVFSQDETYKHFPKGMKLLCYVYKETQASFSSSHYLLMLSLLQMTWAPFVLFIREWVFNGVLKDYYQEFIIRTDHACRVRRDEQYWTGTFTLVEEYRTHGNLPDFLQDIIEHIVNCGKSINLLRVCEPQHFMCNLPTRDIPGVMISFSPTDLQMMESNIKTYSVRMRQIAASVSVDRFDMQAKRERDKEELQRIAREVADKEIQRLQGIIDGRREEEDKKKREELKRLKEQMITDLERRANDEKTAKEEDRQFISRLNREEAALTQEEIELEKKARDHLIAYYDELGEEAMHRERRALWKVRRAHLDYARSEFHAREEEKWSREMQEMEEGREVFESVDVDDLPKWMRKSTDPQSPMEVSDLEEISVPKWAQQELPPESRFVPDYDDEAVEGLPDWARKGANDSTLEVGGEGGEDEEDEEDGKDRVDGEKIGDGGEGDLDESIREFKAFQSGGNAANSVKKPFLKTTKKGVLHAHASDETTMTNVERPSHSQLKAVAGKHISDQSECERTPDKARIKMVDGASVLQESEETPVKPHTKMSDRFSSSRETESVEERSRIKCQEGVSVSEESSEERRIIPRRHRNESSIQISTESQPEAVRIKKASLFGHVSQLSNADHVMRSPRLRRQSAHQANDESQSKDFGIKARPRIRMNLQMSATKESDENDGPMKAFRPGSRFFTHRNANLESVHVDENELRMKKFKSLNSQGHSSDSTVQRLLYGSPARRGDTQTVLDELPPLAKIGLRPGPAYRAKTYEEEFAFDGGISDLSASVRFVDIEGSLVDPSLMSVEETEAHRYTPLSILMSRSIASPIRAQMSLVNRAVVNFLVVDLKVEEHMAAIRRYLLMADGDFTEILSNILMEKLSSNPLPGQVLSAVFLNSTLHKAISSSSNHGDQYARNLSWVCKYVPKVLMPNEPQSLKCLELCYNVKWPLNVVLTESAMHQYGLVFGFLLQIKRVVWTLKDVWHRCKRDALISKVGNCPQFRKLQLYRQEMEFFVKTMQAYVANQVIQVTWQELQASLSRPLDGVDQLREVHDKYVHSAVSRCLLNKKAHKLMKCIRDIFCLILKFRSQLISASWQPNDQKETVHGNFSHMTESYQSFHVHSMFLFKVLYRLSEKGYQPHLQELLVQLNFNGFYSEAAN